MTSPKPPQKTSLELHFGSESENYGALRPSTHVRVVLNDRLQKEHRQRVQKRVEFNAVLVFQEVCREEGTAGSSCFAHIPVTCVVKVQSSGSLKRSPVVRSVLLRLTSGGLQS